MPPSQVTDALGHACELRLATPGNESAIDRGQGIECISIPGIYSQGERVEFRARACPALDSSNRFMRRFGSRRFIRVRIQKDALKQGTNLKEYFRQSFIVGIAVFCAFFAKERNGFLVGTNEVVKGRIGEELRITTPDPRDSSTGISFMDFIEWRNDPLLNSDQVS